MNNYFSRIFLFISAFLSINATGRADAAFLSEIPFSDVYTNIDVIANK